MSQAAPSQSGSSTNLADLKASTKNLPAETQLSFFTAGGMELMQRAAHLLAYSTLVPKPYQAVWVKRDKYGNQEGQAVKNPNALSNCVLALNMSQRMGADPLMIMQNLYIVEGRPGWSSQFITAAINACGKFSPLRFDIEDLGEQDMEWSEKVWEKNQNTGKDFRKNVNRKARLRNIKCVAWAIEKATGERISSPPVSIEMAVLEGWYGKDGSKWKTMPEVMLRYRAASFFGKLYAPELLMGISTAEEIHDTIDLAELEHGAFGMDEPKGMTVGDIKGALPQSEPGEHIDMDTGEVRQAEPAPAPAPQDQPAPQQAAVQNQGIDDADATFECSLDPGRTVTEADCEACARRSKCPEWGGGEQ